MFGGFLFIPQYLQLVRGLSPLEAGLWTLPWALAFVVGSMVTPELARLARPSTLMAGGARVRGGRVRALHAASHRLRPVVGRGRDRCCSPSGWAPVFTLTNDLIIGSAPPERAGAAAGISETAAELGGALGIAVFGSIGIAIYRGVMATDIPAGVPAAAAETSRDTLGGAVEAASALPEGVGASLVETAREAFLSGLRLSAIISSIGTFALALAVVTFLRRIGADRADPLATEGRQPATVDAA